MCRPFTFVFINVFLLLLCKSNGQQIAMQQCERYSTGIDKAIVGDRVTSALSRRPRFIVGGIKTAAEEFPFMVALGYDDNGNIQWECGGALISENFVVTAAHCATHRELGSIKMVRLGTIDLRVPLGQEPARDIEVKSIMVHPRYTPPSMYNDIALVELRARLQFSSKIQPACVHTDSRLDNVLVTAMGWGRVDFTGDKSNDLLKVVLNLVTEDECGKAYSSASRGRLDRGIESKTQICAGSRDNQVRDTCQGDSGGPLQMSSGSKHIIVGITSFGKACGLTNNPGVYTRVAAFVPWIEKIVWKQ